METLAIGVVEKPRLYKDLRTKKASIRRFRLI